MAESVVRERIDWNCLQRFRNIIFLCIIYIYKQASWNRKKRRRKSAFDREIEERERRCWNRVRNSNISRNDWQFRCSITFLDANAGRDAGNTCANHADKRSFIREDWHAYFFHSILYLLPQLRTTEIFLLFLLSLSLPLPPLIIVII